MLFVRWKTIQQRSSSSNTQRRQRPTSANIYVTALTESATSVYSGRTAAKHILVGALAAAASWVGGVSWPHQACLIDSPTIQSRGVIVPLSSWHLDGSCRSLTVHFFTGMHTARKRFNETRRANWLNKRRLLERIDHYTFSYLCAPYILEYSESFSKFNSKALPVCRNEKWAVAVFCV